MPKFSQGSRLEDDLLNLHLVEQVVTFYRVRQGHDLVEHEATVTVRQGPSK